MKVSHFKTQLQVQNAFLLLYWVQNCNPPLTFTFVHSFLHVYMSKLNSGVTHPKREKALEDQETHLQASDQTQITPPRPHPRAGEFSLASSLFSLLPRLLFSSIFDLFYFVSLKPKPEPNIQESVSQIRRWPTHLHSILSLPLIDLPSLFPSYQPRSDRTLHVTNLVPSLKCLLSLIFFFFDLWFCCCCGGVGGCVLVGFVWVVVDFLWVVMATEQWGGFSTLPDLDFVWVVVGCACPWWWWLVVGLGLYFLK